MRRVVCFAITLLAVLTIGAAGPITGLTGEKKLKAYENLVNETEWSGEVNTVLSICDEWIQYAQQEGNLAYEEAGRNKRLTLIYNSEDWLRLEKGTERLDGEARALGLVL